MFWNLFRNVLEKILKPLIVKGLYLLYRDLRAKKKTSLVAKFSMHFRIINSVFSSSESMKSILLVFWFESNATFRHHELCLSEAKGEDFESIITIAPVNLNRYIYRVKQYQMRNLQPSFIPIQYTCFGVVQFGKRYMRLIDFFWCIRSKRHNLKSCLHRRIFLRFFSAWSMRLSKQLAKALYYITQA